MKQTQEFTEGEFKKFLKAYAPTVIDFKINKGKISITYDMDIDKIMKKDNHRGMGLDYHS